MRHYKDNDEMACLNTLKLEIKTLERTFTKNHERFRILHASVDELTCRFIGKNGKNYDIHANITVIIPFHFFLSLSLCLSFSSLFRFSSISLLVGYFFFSFYIFSGTRTVLHTRNCSISIRFYHVLLSVIFVFHRVHFFSSS